MFRNDDYVQHRYSYHRGKVTGFRETPNGVLAVVKWDSGMTERLSPNELERVENEDHSRS